MVQVENKKSKTNNLPIGEVLPFDDTPKVTKQQFQIPTNKLWKLAAIFSNEKIENAQKKYITNEEIAFHLLKESTMIYYVNEAETHLFLDKSKLYEQRFGKLKPISILDAFLKYGIDNLEEAIEKTYAVL